MNGSKQSPLRRSARVTLTALAVAGSTWIQAETAIAAGPIETGPAADAVVESIGSQLRQTFTGPIKLAPVAILGSAAAAGQIAGGATYISEQDLEKFEFTDIQRILRQVPGVSIQLEDGFGLRPNISIRGTPSDRSARITLLEDGIPIAPAPYSAPAAYYFPTAGRIQAIEVLKGPAAILQGPYTTGGAINLLSTRIPDTARGQLSLEAGSHGHLRGHAWFGDSRDHFGYVFEGHEWRSDGFQNIDRSSRDTGLDKSDYSARFRLNTSAAAENYHALELKLQAADETSDQTYFGQTDLDFKATPNRRYGVGEFDQFRSDHDQFILSYTGRFGDWLELSSSAYYNDFFRDWFKSEGIDFDGSPNAQEFSSTNWFDLIQAINRGQSLGGLTPAQLQAILDGSADSAPGAIQLRSNAREYFSRGIQAEALFKFDTGPIRHRLRLGTRLHEDEEDRLQRNSTYTQINGALVLEDLGLLGNAGNQIESADAWATWIYNEMSWGRLQLSPGVRIEDMQLKRVRYENRVGRTDDPASRDPSNLRDQRSNDLTVVLPGIGVRYQLTRDLDLILGVNKGFSAPSSDAGADEEESTNWEAGFRYNGTRLRLDMIAFLNDFQNLVGVCTESSGSNCEVGDRFRGDAARTRGLETRLAWDWSTGGRLGLPFEASWTWTNSEFRSDLADSNFFGDARKGDPLPYIPDHQFYLSQGVTWQRWAGYLSLNHVDAVCTFASCGPFERTDGLTTIDAALNFDLTPRVQLYALGQNLTADEAIAGRQPRGARPNLDRTFIGGLRIQL